MNQILTVENRKKTRTLEIKRIIKFFCVAIMVFGIAFVGQGAYSIYKDIKEQKTSSVPTITVERENDKAVINVKHNVEISKIVYSWGNGEENAIPVNNTTAREEILLVGHNGILNITIEDINGRKTKYQKEYNLEGVDITKPSIEIETKDGNSKMVIIAKDEKAIEYMSYQWDGEEAVRVEAETEGQTEIRKEVQLELGTKKITIIAQDTNGNIEKIEKEITTSTAKPKMWVRKDGQNIIIEAEDIDGVKDIIVNLNGKIYSAKDINRKSVKVGPVKLREGNNTISVEVTNINGYTQKATAELQYNS